MSSLTQTLRFSFLFTLSFFLFHLNAQTVQQKNEDVHPDARYAEAIELNVKANGFKGIWYMNQPSNDEYVYKYSGGMATYTIGHQPMAIYSKKADKTFFCYGATNDNNSTLYHAVSFFDHRTGKVANPTIVLDKNTNDAHDNPVISMDDKGYLWLFSTSHGTTRPSYIYKSVQPFSIGRFEQVKAVETVNGKQQAFDNFSYFQVWHVKSQGFFAIYSKYQGWNSRVIGFNSSKDGVVWNEWKVLAHIEEGHYSISGLHEGKIAVAFNYHPKIGGREQGLNHRTNLYYVETTDFGKSWQTASRQKVEIPLTRPDHPALVKDFKSEGLLCYLQDLNFDRKGNPIILLISSKGYQPGPANDPRTWEVFSFNKKWENAKITTSHNNYDTGAIYVEKSGTLRVAGPTGLGPQPYNPGGEMQVWEKRPVDNDWTKVNSLTSNSSRNHNYFKRPLNTHPDFYGYWADGHGRRPSESYMYFANKKGEVFSLPRTLTDSLLIPQKYSQQ